MIGPTEMWHNLLGYQDAWFNSVCPCQSIDVACKALDPSRFYTNRDKVVELTAGVYELLHLGIWHVINYLDDQ